MCRRGDEAEQLRCGLCGGGRRSVRDAVRRVGDLVSASYSCGIAGVVCLEMFRTPHEAENRDFVNQITDFF